MFDPQNPTASWSPAAAPAPGRFTWGMTNQFGLSDSSSAPPPSPTLAPPEPAPAPFSMTSQFGLTDSGGGPAAPTPPPISLEQQQKNNVFNYVNPDTGLSHLDNRLNAWRSSPDFRNQQEFGAAPISSLIAGINSGTRTAPGANPANDPDVTLAGLNSFSSGGYDINRNQFGFQVNRTPTSGNYLDLNDTYVDQYDFNGNYIGSNKFKLDNDFGRKLGKAWDVVVPIIASIFVGAGAAGAFAGAAGAAGGAGGAAGAGVTGLEGAGMMYAGADAAAAASLGGGASVGMAGGTAAGLGGGLGAGLGSGLSLGGSGLGMSASAGSGLSLAAPAGGSLGGGLGLTAPASAFGGIGTTGLAAGTGTLLGSAALQGTTTLADGTILAPAGTSGAGAAAGAGGSSTTSNLSNASKLNSLVKLLGGGGNSSNSSSGSGGSGGFGLGDLLSLIGGGIDANNQGEAADKMLAWLNANQAKMDGFMQPDSPEWNAMWEQMSRKDAAAGRNSQYGPRTADFLARVATAKADNTRQFTTGNSRAYADALNQNAAKYAGLVSALSHGAAGGSGGMDLGSIANLIGSGGSAFWDWLNSDEGFEIPDQTYDIADWWTQ